MGGPQYRPQNTIILLIGTLKRVPLILEKLPYSKLPGWSKEVGMAFVLPRAALQCVPLAANEPRDGQGIGMIVRLVIVIVIVIVIVRILLMIVQYSYCWYDLVVIIVRILEIKV